jgi:MFS family permease
VYAGLLLLAGSTLAFGFLHNEVLLDAARFVEGVGGACSWAGGLAWIVVETAPGRRGALMGAALGAAVGGALFGPVIGTVAVAIGRAATFSGVVAIALILIDLARRLPLRHTPSGQGLRYLGRAMRDPRLLAGMWLVTLPAIASGAANVLGPLRLHRFGAAAAVIGVTYLVGSGFEALISPTVGGLSDRHGRMLPVRLGLLAMIPLLLCFTLPGDVPLLALLIVGIDGALGFLFAPAMALTSDVAEGRRLDQGLAAALMNLAWAAGQIVGSSAGGGIAKASGDGLPMILTAGLFAVTLLALWRRGRLVA